MKKLAILLVVFLGLALFVYYYEIQGQKKREKAKEVQASLFSIKQDDITSVEVAQQGKEPVLFVKEGGNWVIKRPVETSADTTTVDSLLRNIETAKTERTLTEGPRKLEEFGLKSPRLTLKVKTKSQQKVLLIGKDDYTGNQVYVQLQGKPNVDLTSDYIFTTADKDLLQWRNKKVLAFERDKIQVVEIQRPHDKIVLKKQGDKWRMEAPIKEAADESTVSSFLSTLEFAEAQKFVVEQADDLKPYDLAKPPVVVRLQEQGQDHWKRLELGKKEGSDYLARNPDRSPVFAVKEEVYQKLTQKLWEFRDKDVVDVAQDQIAKLEIRRGKEEIVIKHQETKWTVEKPAAQRGKEALTYKFWYPIDDIKFESIEDKKASDSAFAKPDVQVAVTLKDGSSRTFDFVAKGDRYLARQGQTGRQGAISKDSFEKLRMKPEEIV